MQGLLEAERAAAAERGEDVGRCNKYIETVEARLRIHSEYIGQLEVRPLPAASQASIL